MRTTGDVYLWPAAAERKLRMAYQAGLPAYLYGVTGVGKTSLIRHFLEKKEYFYVSALNTTPDDLESEKITAPVIVLDDLYAISDIRLKDACLLYTSIDSGRIAKIYPHAVKQYLPDYMGLIFEKMCQDYLLYYSDSLPIELSEIGQWWGTDPKKKKQTQIDIVGTPVEGKDYIIGSCKYRNEKIGVDELDLIRDYASVFGKGNNYYYYIFSKGGFTDGLLQAQERGEVRLITLEDLYK